MRAVADENLAALADTFGRALDTTTLPGRAIRREHLVDAEVLLVRSVTRVNAELLDGTPVRFVGSATIGADHLDTDWMDANGIHWATAPGCNADAAAQYTLGMMVLACQRLGRDLRQQRVGVFGRGNVGGRLVALLDALGVEVVACDPPLAAQGETGLVTPRQALGADIVSLHTPLTRSGRWPTAGMIDANAIASMPHGVLLVNAARGDIVARGPLLEALARRRLRAALDTWPGEPDIRSMSLDSITVATPHVAGYSRQGKRRGTAMIHQAWQRWAETPLRVETKVSVDEIHDVEPPSSATDVVESAILSVTRIIGDDARMREIQPVSDERFDALRRDYVPRQEFAACRVRLPVDNPDARQTLARLGFQVAMP